MDNLCNNATVSSPTVLPVQVIDGSGASASITDLSTIASCTASPCPTITVTPTATNASCGNNNGAVNITITGGATPYTFSWSNGATSQNLSNVGVGSYTVTVTDANTCTGTASASVANTGGPTVTIGTVTNATCGNNNGAVNITISGGATPYNFSWTNGATSQNLSNVGAGSYTVTVTDANTCTGTASANITSTSAPTVTLGTVTNASCGASDGAININVSGGATPYNFNWTNGATSQNLSNIGVGSYSVTVTDANTCTANLTANISNTSGPTITDSNLVSPSCPSVCDGSASITVSGGTLPYTYSWKDSLGNTVGGNSNTLSNLCTGNYTVTVTDNGGGGGPTPTTIFSEDFESGAPSWNLNVVMGTEGTDPNFFKISDEEGGVLPNGCGVAGNGNKTLFITSVFNPNGGAAYDAGGLCGVLYCPETHRQTESPAISTVGYTGLTLSFDFIANGDIPNDQATIWYSTNGGTTWTQLGSALQSTTCGTGQGQWTAFSQTLPASCENIANLKIAVRWDNNDDGVGTDPSVAVNNIKIVSSVAGGGSSCSVVHTYNISAPTALNATFSGLNTNYCLSDPTVNLTPTQTGGTFSGAGVSGNTFNPSTAGIGTHTIKYVLTSGTCTDSTTQTVTVNGVNLTLGTVSNATCGNMDGAINITVSGGTSPYNFNWSNGSSTQNITNIGDGNYSVTVTDLSGCSSTLNNISVTSSGSFTLSETITQPTCTVPTGSISVTPNGGTSPYNYSWSNGATTSSINNLAPGSYSVTVNDSSGCSVTKTYVINNTANFDFTVETTPTNCWVKNGTATVNIISGSGTFTYQYSPSGDTTQAVDSLDAGNYSVTVTDGNGCSVNHNFTIGFNDSIGTSINASSTIVPEGGNTILTVTTSPSVTIYTYTWNPTSTLSCSNCPNPVATPIGDTWYYVTITTQEGCIGKDSVLIHFKKNCGDVFIPNVFSPDQNNLNDSFKPLGVCIAKGNMTIYNRWGNVVYQTNDIKQGWDGTQAGQKANTGNYVYKIELTLEDGTIHNYSGSVTLTR